MDSGKGSCTVCGGLIRLCGGLDFFPVDVEIRRLLVERLHRLARDHKHAGRMIDHWLDTQAAAPKVADLVSLSNNVRSEQAALPDACDACHGEPWIVPDERGARRCECARGHALAAKDRERGA